MLPWAAAGALRCRCLPPPSPPLAPLLSADAWRLPGPCECFHVCCVRCQRGSWAASRCWLTAVCAFALPWGAVQRLHLICGGAACSLLSSRCGAWSPSVLCPFPALAFRSPSPQEWGYSCVPEPRGACFHRCQRSGRVLHMCTGTGVARLRGSTSSTVCWYMHIQCAQLYTLQDNASHTYI